MCVRTRVGAPSVGVVDPTGATALTKDDRPSHWSDSDLNVSASCPTHSLPQGYTHLLIATIRTPVSDLSTGSPNSHIYRRGAVVPAVAIHSAAPSKVRSGAGARKDAAGRAVIPSVETLYVLHAAYHGNLALSHLSEPALPVLQAARLSGFGFG
jgi:hypothetical protein